MEIKEKVALYPGSFDPITNGHLDIIKRARDIFDRLVIAVADNPDKQTLFTKEERIGLIKDCTSDDNGITVTSFSGLTSSFASELRVQAIVRGLRMVSDFEFEFQMALMNRKLMPNADTIFLMPSEQYTYLSSSLIKDIARFKGNVGCFVPENVARALKEKNP